jgi:hypothetical protein
MFGCISCFSLGVRVLMRSDCEMALPLVGGGGIPGVKLCNCACFQKFYMQVSSGVDVLVFQVV